MNGLADLKERIAESAFFKSPFYIKYHQFVIPVAVMIIAVLVSVLVTIPQLYKFFETSKNIDSLKQKKTFFQQKVAKLENVNLEATRNDLDTALVALPGDKDIPGVIGELLVALSGSGMSLDGITFSGTGAESETIGEYTIKMDVTGTNDSLRNFLERVKVTPRVIVLTSLDINKTKTGKLSASVGLVTLYQKLPADIGLIDEKVPELSSVDTQLLADIQTKLRSIPQNSSASAELSNSGKLNPFTK